MKRPRIEVQDVQVFELRKNLRLYLESKRPVIVRRNSRPVGIVLSVQTSWYGNLEPTTSQIRRLRAELAAVIAMLDGELTLE
jgi:hypothetical protein